MTYQQHITTKTGQRRRTRSRLHSSNIILSYIVLNPRPVDVLLAPVGGGTGVQLLGDDTVSEETGREGDLQTDPVLALADV